jgi:coenzyme F420-reducing hydrogenase delta subunit
MRKAVVAAAVLAAASLQGASAADRHCYSAADLEAEQAIVFQTNLMVISSACRDTVYGQFRARNSGAIIRYQRIMINHFRREGARNAQSEFDAWNTGLANEISLKQGAVPTVVVCQKAADLEKMASTLDTKGLHDYAVAQAASPAETHPRCLR